MTTPLSSPKKISKSQALEIAAATASMFIQGNTWVVQEWDLEAGVNRLTRCLSQEKAKIKLRKARLRRIEELMRANPEATGYVIQRWVEHPSWNDGIGMWDWALKSWFGDQNEADEMKAELEEESPGRYQVATMAVEEIPQFCKVHVKDLP